MTVLFILSAGLVAVFGYLVSWFIYCRTLHPLSKVPGPFWPSVTRLWLTYAVSRGELDVVQRDLHRRYGPLVRIAPDEIACADPEAIRKIYSTTSPLNKSDFYHIWDVGAFSKYPNAFAIVDENMHFERRRIVSSVYSMSTVLTLEPYIDNCSRLFVKRMTERTVPHEAIDLGDWFLWYAYDVIGELFFGHSLGFIENRGDEGGFLASLEVMLPVLTIAAASSPLVRGLIMGLFTLSSTARKGLKGMNHIIETARASVDKRASAVAEPGKGERKDLLHNLLNIVSSKGDKLDFGIEDVKNEAFAALTAGADATMIELQAIFYYLVKDRSVYEELRKEVDQAVETGKLSEFPSYSEVVQLPLLKATIKEALRLHPAVGFTMPRVVGQAGIELLGMYIPPGWKVGMNAAVVGRDEGVYGTDANTFRPERWIERTDSDMDRCNNLVFGAGTRTCIGKQIALSEIYKMVPLLIRKFDFALVDPSKSWTTHDYFFNKQSGVQVKVTVRGL
uniref:Cytochrome P450 monooxygenase gsfF n=1 Tax=Penicillium aethiopicum TaxID=36650 RepID=GSFF_PENAE|nr:RecName: Full=Cytochrome P450 monooxygenase gsfF; AltName: Full=Griseofulvin synthesis protein F; Flags: Precursor [Penicillium aethiopicum]ADI24958.2 GsfF [Penicillium aethiopicum]